MFAGSATMIEPQMRRRIHHPVTISERPDRNAHLANQFFTTQYEAGEQALPNFQAALRLAAERGHPAITEHG